MPTVTIHLREVDNDAKLGGDLSVSGATNLEGNSIVDGTLSVGGNASFAGEIQTSNLDVGGKLSVQGNSKFVGDTVIDKSLSLGGNIFATETQTSNLNVNGNTFIEGLVGIGVTDPTDALDVSGNINFSGTLKQGGNPFVSTPWTIQSNPAALSYTAGNIGINTTSPGRLLEVFTGNGNIPGLRLRRYATGSTYTDFQHADNTSPANSKEGLAIITSDGNATTQEVMRICVGGVGIGTTSPAYKLHIHQNDLSVYQRFTTTASGQTDIFDIAQWNSTRNNGDTGVMFINRANSDMRFLNNDIEVMRLKANGNVGIGTNNPSVQLHIKGTSPRTLSTPNGPSYVDYGQLVITDTTAPSSTSTLGNLKLGFDASTGAFGTGFIQCVNPNIYTGPLVIQPYGGNVGINTTIPYTKLHVLNTDDNTGTGDGFISGLTANTDNRKPSECLRLQGQWRSPGSGALLRFTNTHGGGTNPNTGEYNLAGIGGIDYDNNWGGALCFYTSRGDQTGGNNLEPRMLIDNAGNVGIGTDAPESRLHVNGNAIIGDIGVTTGLGHTDAQLILAGTHNTNYNNSDKIKLLISGGNNDGNSPYDIMCEDENGHDNFWLKGPVNEGGTDGVMYMKGKIGIRTSSPARALDVHAAARPSDYPFSIGGTWSNRSKYLAVEVNPGNNKTSLYRDFLMGGHLRPIWVRVHYAGSASGSGQLQQTGYAEFTVSLYGTNTYASRRAGDAHISIARNGVHNGFRVTMGSGQNMSYPRAWIEVYSETGVYF